MSKTFGFIGSNTDIPPSCIDPIFMAVEKAKAQGYKTGVSGGLPGIELWGAWTTGLAGLDLHLILPFEGYQYYYIAKYFGGELSALEFYKECLEEAKKVSYVEVVPKDFGEYSEEKREVWIVANLQKKNQLVASKVDLLISLWDYKEELLLPSLKYAVKKGVKVVNLNPLTAQWKGITEEDIKNATV